MFTTKIIEAKRALAFYKLFTDPDHASNPAPRNNNGLKTWKEWCKYEARRIGGKTQIGELRVWPGVHLVWIEKHKSEWKEDVALLEAE